MIKYLPNTLTLSGLLSGMMGLVALIQGRFLDEGRFLDALWWIFLVSVLDVLDGLVARAMGCTSEAGKYLDALADMFSFGIFPAFSLYFFIQHHAPEATYAAYGAFLIAPCTALRLTRYLKELNTSHFQGLPAPAATLFIVSLWLLDKATVTDYPPALWMLLGWGVGALMCAPIAFLAFKFAHYRWKGNETRYILLFLFLIGAIWLQEKVFLLSIPLYVGFSLLKLCFKRRKL